MCSRGMSTLLWPSRSGVFSRDYVSYGARTSSSGRRYSSSYSRPVPLAYSVGASPGSCAYYGSRYRASTSSSLLAPDDPWTASPRTAPFAQSQRQSRRVHDGQYSHCGHYGQYQQRGPRRSQHDSASSYRAAADAFRHSSGGGATFDPVADSEPPSRQRRVRFADNVACHYSSGGGGGDTDRNDPASAFRQDEGRRRRRRGGREGGKDGYRRSGSGDGDYRGYTRHGQQADHESACYDAYERSPRAAILRRNSSRLDDAGIEDMRRRASKHGRKGTSCSVQVEVLYS